jgi:hypothetical protein
MKGLICLLFYVTYGVRYHHSGVHLLSLSAQHKILLSTLYIMHKHVKYIYEEAWQIITIHIAWVSYPYPSWYKLMTEVMHPPGWVMLETTTLKSVMK